MLQLSQLNLSVLYSYLILTMRSIHELNYTLYVSQKLFINKQKFQVR